MSTTKPIPKVEQDEYLDGIMKRQSITSNNSLAKRMMERPTLRYEIASECMAAALIVIYVPSACNRYSVLEFGREFGGYTSSTAVGTWYDKFGNAHIEEVVRYEIVAKVDRNLPVSLKDLGAEFLRANPEEQEFLATIASGQATRSVRVYREEY